MRYRWGVLVGGVLVAAMAAWLALAPVEATPQQTRMQDAAHRFDGDGVSEITIEGVGRVRHPAWIALYALAYGGAPAYTADHAVAPDAAKFDASIAWLEKNLVQNARGQWVWEYPFDSTYNDISIAAPWNSAFAQATGIEALLLAYARHGDRHYLETALKAAQVLFVPLAEGGQLFRQGEDVWFEEIPEPRGNPGHILNGHMRAVMALHQLAKASGDATVAQWAKAGADTLYRWLPRYDSGYWLRYDLNPRKQELLFRLAEPYGREGLPLAIESIALHDPVSKRTHRITVGDAAAFEGANRLAGVHWTAPETVDGKVVRRLVPAAIAEPDGMGAPHSYVYFSLPGEWADNRRDGWYEIELRYYDEKPGYLALQQRSIAPGVNFRDMRDGDLMLNGEGVWRSWKIPLRPTDLGYPVGNLYALKHAEYLADIAAWDARFKPWATAASAYDRAANRMAAQAEMVIEKKTLPTQTPMLPIFSFDADGVVMQHQADNDSRFGKDGIYDRTSSKGTPVYTPYIVAEQLVHGQALGGYYTNAIEHVKRKPALRWFSKTKNQFRTHGAVLYRYPFDNVYNDVVSKAPWASAFGQAAVLKALLFADEHKVGSDVRGLMLAVAKGFTVDIAQGGIRSTGRDGTHFYEEVPNGSHVLNGHLLSTVVLKQVADLLKNDALAGLHADGLESLRERLHLFDSGYWLRYDLNPKKELLLQFDWLEGEQSPLLGQVHFTNPATGHGVKGGLGTRNSDAKDAPVRISGTDWQERTRVDGKPVRGFQNGYRKHATALQGGTRQNAYLFLQLPDAIAPNEEVLPHLLTLRYKDIAPGRFAINIRSIHEGNYLALVPLRQGVLTMVGDGAWKEAHLTIRPQDMGWYKGPDYQQYEVEQLHLLAENTGDWFFAQYAQRHADFLKRYRAETPLFAPSPQVQDAQ